MTGPLHGTLSGTLPNVIYSPFANFYGSDSVTFKANDKSVPWNDPGRDSTATVSITVNPVNDAPSFTKGANQAVKQNAGPQSVAGWATAISAGPANEGSQTVDLLTTNNNSTLFSTQPAISGAGTLTYTSSLNASGLATVTARSHDK